MEDGKYQFNCASVTKAIFLDILNAKWSAYRTEDLTKQQLEHAGFKEIKFIYDDAHLFPTVVAKK